MARIRAQDIAEEALGLAPLPCEHRRRGLLHVRAVRIGERRALEGDARIVVLPEVDEHVAVGEPGEMMV